MVPVHCVRVTHHNGVAVRLDRFSKEFVIKIIGRTMHKVGTVFNCSGFYAIWSDLISGLEQDPE
jgi:hypothetical protein